MHERQIDSKQHRASILQNGVCSHPTNVGDVKFRLCFETCNPYYAFKPRAPSQAIDHIKMDARNHQSWQRETVRTDHFKKKHLEFSFCCRDPHLNTSTLRKHVRRTRCSWTSLAFHVCGQIIFFREQYFNTKLRNVFLSKRSAPK